MPLYLGKTPIGGTEVTLTPNGTKSITENGIHDVTQYASVDVNVAGGGGSVETCTVTITANTTSNVFAQFVSYAALEDGKVTPKYAPQFGLVNIPYTITVVKGMPVGIFMNGAFIPPLISVPSDWEVSILDGTHGTFIPYSDGEIVFNYD